MPEAINYQLLAQAMMQQMATKAVSSTPTATMGHGQGGLFSAPGLSRQVFSAMMLPNLGLQSSLPVRGANETNPLYGIVTGVTATTGSEPTGVCDDPPVVGLTKMCTHSFVFGRQSRMTKVYDIDTFGRTTNRGEFSDFQLLGTPWQDGQVPTAPMVPGSTNMSQVLNNEIAKAMFEFAVAWSRDFAREIYTGNPTNNTSGGGRKYFFGLDILIDTGYRDAETGVLCPAADSIVRSFGDLNIASNGASLVLHVANMYRNLRFIASRAGLDPVTWALTMPWGMFYELSAVWPCSYYTSACATAGAPQQQINVTDQTNMRDAMRGDMFSRTGQYLLIDGQRVPVVIDDAITETEVGSGVFESAIYFVPLRVLGGTPVTFLEYFNYDSPGGAMDAARTFAADGQYYTSDGGRFLWHKKPPTNFCVQLLAKTEPRLVLLTPHLAAKITDIRYTPIAHQRDWDTTGAYFVDGGLTSRTGLGPSWWSSTYNPAP